MKSLTKQKESAIEMRKKGKTYGEISKEIDISKSTLSTWLRDIIVPEEFVTRITQKKLEAVSLGWQARRNERIERTEQITLSAQKEVAKLIRNPLWLVGLTLYWAEGHKEKAWSKSTLVTFTNMDENTIVLFKAWCQKFLQVSDEDFVPTLYIHDSRKNESIKMRNWWAKKISVSPEGIAIYYKKAAKKHVRHNDADSYHGVMRLRIKKSVDMNRRIAAWTAELVHSLKNKNAIP